MSNEPRELRERLSADKLLAVIREFTEDTGSYESLPFDPVDAEDMPPMTCECGGDLVRLRVSKDRRGKHVVRVREEYIVCFKCLKGLR